MNTVDETAEARLAKACSLLRQLVERDAESSNAFWYDSQRDEVRDFLKSATPKPIDMILLCPECKTQHIDMPNRPASPGLMAWSGDATDGLYRGDPGWTNPPHRSHLCATCGCIWRPADVPTNGVAKLQTVGKADTCHFDPAWQVSSGTMRKLIRDGEHWQKLMQLAGYFQDGSDQCVRLSQDDTTRTCHIDVGYRNYYSDSFEAALKIISHPDRVI